MSMGKQNTTDNFFLDVSETSNVCDNRSSNSFFDFFRICIIIKGSLEVLTSDYTESCR